MSEAQSTDARTRAIVSAARDEFVRCGIRRANMESIAQRAGVSRVTVHRHFGTKPDLLHAVVRADIVAFVKRFDRVWYAVGPVEERIVDAIVLTVTELRRHPLLTTIIRSEPDVLLAALTLEGKAEFELLCALLGTRVHDLSERDEIAPVDSVRVAEFMIRLGLTVFVFPFGVLPGHREEEVRAFAHEYVLPIVVGRRPWTVLGPE